MLLTNISLYAYLQNCLTAQENAHDHWPVYDSVVTKC